MEPVAGPGPDTDRRSRLGLEWLLPDRGETAFLHEVLGKTELFVPGQDGKFASILEWSKVNFLMMHGRVGTHVLLQSRTEAGHQDTSTIDVSSAGHGLVHVQQQLRTGATLVIDQTRRS